MRQIRLDWDPRADFSAARHYPLLLRPHWSIAALLASVFLAPLTHSSADQRVSAPASATSFAALAARADAARDLEHLDEAVKLYHAALVLRPSWAEGWWSLGTLEYDRDHYTRSAVAFRKLLALQPSNGTAHAMLGLCEFELRDYDQALRHIQKGKSLGLQDNPDLWHVVLYHQGILLQRRGKFQAAQEAFEELCLLTGPNDKLNSVLGMTMLRSDAVEPPAPDSIDAQVVRSVGRAECLAGQKKFDEAKPIFERTVIEHRDYPSLHYAYGLFLIEVHDVAGAVEQMKEEIRNAPNNVIARLRIAATEFKQDSSAGIPYAEEAVKLDPKSPFGHYILGLLRLDVDDYMNAIPELEIAQKGMPREPKIYFALGTAYSRAGRKQDAARARATFQHLTEKAKKIAQSPQQSADAPISVEDSELSPH